MGDIIIQNILSQGVTIISNLFIDKYMAQANGEFIKVYLFLLRSTQGNTVMSLSAIADALECTERDVTRALKYWEKLNLIQLTYESRKLTGIAFCPLPSESASVEVAVEKEPAKVEPKNITTSVSRKSLTADQIKELKQKEDVRQFLYIAEQYLGRTLTKTDVDNFLYFYSQLHFSAELIEYLVEYCVSKGSLSARYIQTVALAWSKDGITSVEEAKKASNLYNKNYFTILKSMGIKGRNPVEAEQKFMDSWLNTMGFSLDLITEACQRTVLQTGQASFQYADSILKGWHKKGVHHLTDLEPLDEAHRKKVSKMPQKVSGSSPNGKGEYPHRDYDYDEIKKTLFNQ